jgi:hypothetical protein
VTVSGGAQGLGHEIHAGATRIDPPAPRRRTSSLSLEQRRHVRFVLAVVDLLAARDGFDPASLVDQRTGTPLGPALSRMRDALEASDTEPGPESQRPAG